MNKGEIIAESAVRFTRRLPAPSGRVWQFLTEASRLPEWYGDGRIEPREGGAVSLMGGHIHGVVTGWWPEKFLGYTWSVFQPGEDVSAWPISYLELALQDAGESTTLVLTHRPIPQPMQKLTMVGWHTMLDLVEAGLDGRFPPRTKAMPGCAELYGVDLNTLKR